jgi:large subunit ribosomal protein L25
MEHIAIEARRRDAAVTKAERKRLRRAGHIPAAVFGKGIEPVLVTVEAKELAKVLQSDAGTNTLIDLSLEGARHLVKLTQVDLDPIARTFLHVGLHKIAANEASKATIPVEIVGEPEEVRTGVAMLEPGASSVDVRCLPEDLVASLTLDVSGMKIGDVRYVSDLSVPPRMEVLSAPDTALVSLHVTPAMVEEATEAADEASAEASGAAGAEAG